jgi:hopanoid C-2 methylase
MLSEQINYSKKRKRILIVNCYFDASRWPIRRALKIPQAVGPVYLAGVFSQKMCEVRCYSELASGPLEDERVFAWPDMLVLTGLTNSLDRMLHLTAYARSRNEKVIVVAGGPAVRALPRLANRFFDYVCFGDVEELHVVVVDVFGQNYVAEQILPRYDLGYWFGSMGYAETTRYCNFRCTFCSLTGEDRPYQNQNLDYIRQQLLALGKRSRIIFVDNNFYGNDRREFHARISLLKEMHQKGQFKGWAALVTNDFFSKRENVKLVKDAGCEVLFSGVESFDPEWLRRVNKLQNIGSDQMQSIIECLKTGVVFSYGLMADLTNRRIDDFRRELESILDAPEIPLPSYVCLPIPILGTPYFYESLEERRLLPSVKLRDMDGATVVEVPLDPADKLVAFLANGTHLFNGYNLRVLRHAAHFARIYRKHLTKTQLLLANSGSLFQCVHRLSLSLRLLARSGEAARRTYISPTEPLDRVYTPAFRLDSRFERHFRPTMVTDPDGQMHDDLIDSGLFDKPRKAQGDVLSALDVSTSLR